MIVGIDASNIKEGGGLNHIVKIIENFQYNKHKITKIVLWGNKKINSKIKIQKFIKKKLIF